MEFFNSFIPVYIKCDFISKNQVPENTKNWIECRLNMKPAPCSYRNVQINVYPKCYNEMMPHFTLDVDYANIRCGPVRSHSKENVYGILWKFEQKKCRIFIAFENKTMYQQFSKYFRKLLKFFNLYNNCENVLENENVNSSVFNEAEQMTARKRTSQANDNGGDGDNGDASTKEQIERISDAASGCYEDVVLRPKSEQNNNRRLVRPFAVFSGLFKSHRKSRDVNQEENVTENSAKFLSSCVIVDNKDIKIKPKKKSWNIFKSKKKTQRDSSPSFQHFQEPLNVERVSLPIGPYVDKYNDAEWYDLNREEMSLFEARVSDIVNEFNQNSSQIVCDSETESLYLCDLSRYFTISTNISQNILWSHNLSVECQSNSNPSHISHINLLGANNNRDQIHSDVFIENEEEDIVVDDQTENTKLCGSFNKRLNSSFASIDSDGYTVMQPILQLSQKKYPVEPTVLIDNTMTTKPTTATDYCYNYNSDDFSNLSSGFGSDSDGGGCSSPHERQQSMAFAFAVASPATSDFSEAFPSPALTTNTTPLTTANSTQKTKKCQSLRIRSRKLLSILYAKQMPSNVTTTQQNKSSPECIQQKKMFKGTPFKVHFKKMEGEMVVVKANDVSKKSQHLLH